MMTRSTRRERIAVRALNFSILFVLIASGLSAAEPGRPATVNLTVRMDSFVSKTGGDDIAKLKALASGVGWEFAPNSKTDENLRRLAMKSIRCINVDPLPGNFDEKGAYVFAKGKTRLDDHLQTCRSVGATPHIIIAQGIPAALRLQPKEVQERMAIMGQTPGGHAFWNGDWDKLRSYWKAYFRLVLLDSGFPDARFEVGNEPDIDGQFPRIVGIQGAMGSRALYLAYLELYRNASQAAKEFEKENPGTKVTLGGPALAWAYSFKFGELNWGTEFLKDAAAENLKLDFLGIHFYGNTTSFNGEYPGPYPSFSEMLEATKKARDQYLPGLPIFFTEWGASYTTAGADSLVNASHVGAAWSAVFLSRLLEGGVPYALYLVTTDKQDVDPAKHTTENGWGWPSLFVNPVQFGQPWPKAPSHVFQMIRNLAPLRVALDGAVPESGVDGIASVDKASGDATILLWNYRFRIPEHGDPVDMGGPTETGLRIGAAQGAGASGQDKLLVERWLVSADTSNALDEFQKTGKITSLSELQKVESLEIKASDPVHSFRLPSGSVSFVRIRKSPVSKP